MKFPGVVVKTYDDGCIEVTNSELECEAVAFENNARCKREVVWLNVESYNGHHNYCYLHAVTPDKEMELWKEGK